MLQQPIISFFRVTIGYTEVFSRSRCQSRHSKRRNGPYNQSPGRSRYTFGTTADSGNEAEDEQLSMGDILRSGGRMPCINTEPLHHPEMVPTVAPKARLGIGPLQHPKMVSKPIKIMLHLSCLALMTHVYILAPTPATCRDTLVRS